MSSGAARAAALATALTSAACGLVWGFEDPIDPPAGPTPGEGGTDSAATLVDGEAGGSADATSANDASDAGNVDASDGGLVNDGGPLYAFVSSVLFTGVQLKGLAQADALCTAMANGNLPGKYVAWLSSSSVNAIDRLGTANGPWATPNGEQVVPNKAALVQGTLQRAINMTEYGMQLTSEPVWTGTKPGGNTSGVTCESWTQGQAADAAVLRGTMGSCGNTMNFWTESLTGVCNSNLGRIYCFQVP